MIEKLKELEKKALDEIRGVKTINELNEVKSLYLGKKSPLQEILSKMKEFSVEEKKTIGQAVNSFKVNLENSAKEVLDKLNEEIIYNKLKSESLDVSLDKVNYSVGSKHVLTKMIEELEDIFISMGYAIATGPEIEMDLFNFEMMNLPKDHPARDMQDSFYITSQTLLRTHTSPVQARVMKSSAPNPIKIVCPGKVYRRDYDDATHSHQFMQLEGLVIDKDINMSNLKGTLETVFKKVLGKDTKVRFRPSYFPFTEPSVEVDLSCFKCGGSGCSLCKGNGFIEVLGAGMVHPNVLKMGGYDPLVYRGFAFGIGIERLTMLKYGIDDVRYFYANDPRFIKQF